MRLKHAGSDFRWLALQDLGSPQASFANRHLLLRAVKLNRSGGREYFPPGGGTQPPAPGTNPHLVGGADHHPVLRRMV